MRSPSQSIPRYLAPVLLLALGVVACAGPAPAASAPTATVEPRPTPTIAAPTVTTERHQAPTPTPTAEPTPEPTIAAPSATPVPATPTPDPGCQGQPPGGYQALPDAVTAALNGYGWAAQDALALAERIKRSTLRVMLGGSAWVGSGGAIVTNAHVVEHEGRVVELRDYVCGAYTAEVVSVSAEADLALLRITSDASDLPPALVMGSAEVGDPVMAVGHPGSVGFWVASIGHVTKLDAWGEGGYLASLSSAPGNSGGPVVNAQGEVIGTLSGRTFESPSEQMFPVPIILDVLDHENEGAATLESNLVLGEMLAAFSAR